MEKKKTILQIFIAISFIGTVVVNALANTVPIGGKETGELSDLYPNLFVPAGLTFSIWGLIYILLGAFTVFQMRDIFSRKKKNMPFLRVSGPLFILASAANIGWIFAWHYQKVLLSLLIMLVLLGSLLAIYVRLNIGRGKISRAEKAFVHVPFSVYIGWISVATVANITAFLVHVGWNRFGLSEVFWTVLVVVVVAVITLLMLSFRNDIGYGLVILWAFAGIMIKRFTVDTITIQPVFITLIVTMTLIFLGVLMRFPRWLKS
jgi:disulfide bond formation protein DsbB